jgi:hypothetical protein
LNEPVSDGIPPIHRTNFEKFVHLEEVSTWDQFQYLLNTRFRGNEWVFRGHSDSGWRLETSLERAVLRHVTQESNQPPIEHYLPRHPNQYEDDLLYTFSDGRTSIFRIRQTRPSC